MFLFYGANFKLSASSTRLPFYPHTGSSIRESQTAFSVMQAPVPRVMSLNADPAQTQEI